MASGDVLTEPGTNVVLASIVSMNCTPVVAVVPLLVMLTLYINVLPGRAVA